MVKKWDCLVTAKGEIWFDNVLWKFMIFFFKKRFTIHVTQIIGYYCCTSGLEEFQKIMMYSSRDNIANALFDATITFTRAVFDVPLTRFHGNVQSVSPPRPRIQSLRAANASIYMNYRQSVSGAPLIILYKNPQTNAKWETFLCRRFHASISAGRCGLVVIN